MPVCLRCLPAPNCSGKSPEWSAVAVAVQEQVEPGRECRCAGQHGVSVITCTGMHPSSPLSSSAVCLPGLSLSISLVGLTSPAVTPELPSCFFFCHLQRISTGSCVGCRSMYSVSAVHHRHAFTSLTSLHLGPHRMRSSVTPAVCLTLAVTATVLLLVPPPAAAQGRSFAQCLDPRWNVPVWTSHFLLFHFSSVVPTLHFLLNRNMLLRFPQPSAQFF